MVVVDEGFPTPCKKGARTVREWAVYGGIIIIMKATGVFCVVPVCGLAAFPIR